MPNRTFTIHRCYESSGLSDEYLSGAYEILLERFKERKEREFLNKREAEKMTIVALYARVSSEGQEKKQTIWSQVAEVEKRIAADGYKLSREYIFLDNGFSGTNLNRPDLHKLRDKVTKGKINKIYIHSLDRLSRNIEDKKLMEREFKTAGVQVIYLTHKTEDTAESELTSDVCTAISEYEVKIIKQRNMRGKIHAAKQGRISVMSRAAYGYQYVNRHINGGQACFKINEKEAEVVKKMFLWVGKERMSIRMVARKLHEMSIKTKTGNERWNSTTIVQILKNTVYQGQAAYGKRKVGEPKKRILYKKYKTNFSMYANPKEDWIMIPAPSIVNANLFNKVQEQLAENKKRARVQNRKETFLLQGLVACKVCNSRYFGIYCVNVTKLEARRYYYRCLGANPRNHSGNKICNQKGIRAELLDTVTWEEVKNVLKDQNMIKKEYERKFLNTAKSSLDKEQDLKKKKNEKQRRIDNLINYYHNDELITKEEFERQLKKMRHELKAIEDQLEKAIDSVGVQQEFDLAMNSLESFSSNICAELEQAESDWKTKQDLIRMLIWQVKIDHDNLYVWFRFQELTLEREKKILQHCTCSFNYTIINLTILIITKRSNIS